ncbi:MAG: hypothetical protein ABGW87_10480 [Sphingomonadaceae bacterium]
MAARKKPADDLQRNDRLTVEQTPDETGAQAMARRMLEPPLRHAAASAEFASKILGPDFPQPGLADYITAVEAMIAKAETGNISAVTQILSAQAVTLDSMFGEFSRRSALNMADYPEASDRYARLALKSQANCRATLEALAKLHQPREQIVKHVHVNDGGQAVIADEIHQHGRGANGKTDEQCHATGAAGQSAALLSPDAQGDGVPISSGERSKAVPDARRDKSRRA